METLKKKKNIQFLIHAIAWGLIFSFPLFFISRGDSSLANWPKYIGFLFAPLSLMIVFYTNYFYLIDKYLFRKRTWKFISTNAILILVVGVLIRFWQEMYHPGPPPPHDGTAHWLVMLLFIIRDLISLTLMAGLSVAIKMTYKWFLADNARKELEKSRAEAELKNLKNQLNPHFLFNTLNNIYSLIAFSPEKAQDAVHELSNLLRYVLYDNNQELVPLDKEFDFIRNYIDLMRLRLNQDVKLEIEIPNVRDSKLLIAPLLFITLIENAFKHGVSGHAPSYVKVHLEEMTGKVACTIENSYFPKDRDDRSGSGIGLDNLRRRLELLYPGNFIFYVEQAGDKYISMLTLFIKNEE